MISATYFQVIQKKRKVRKEGGERRGKGADEENDKEGVGDEGREGKKEKMRYFLNDPVAKTLLPQCREPLVLSPSVK